MSLRRLSRSAREAWEVPRDLLRGRYPPFVTGGELPRGDVPVFVFHGAEPESFGRKIAHLAENGYVTLSADEYVAVLRGERQPEERAVVLTFDDGRGSVWSVAAPLLRRLGMKAVVFLVPGRIESRPARPSRPGRTSRKDAWTRLWSCAGRKGRALSCPGRRSRPSRGRACSTSRAIPCATPAFTRGPRWPASSRPGPGEGTTRSTSRSSGTRAGPDGRGGPVGRRLSRPPRGTSEELRFHEDPVVRAAAWPRSRVGRRGLLPRAPTGRSACAASSAGRT